MTQAPTSPRRRLARAIARTLGLPLQSLARLRRGATPRAARPAFFEPLEKRQLLSGSGDLFFGVTMSRTDDPAQAIPLLKEAGAKGVRYWLGTDFKTQSTAEMGGHFRRIHDYAAAGFKVTLTVTTEEYATGSPPSYGDVKGWFSWLLKAAPQLKGDVNRWEIGNEPNLSKYYPTGNVITYIKQMLKPAYEVLHSAGETVVGGAITANVPRQTMVDMKNAGYLNYLDIAAVHPYSHSATSHINYFKLFADVMGTSKPISLSEWNILLPSGSDDHSKTDAWESAWIDQLNQVLDYVGPRVESIYYYNFALRSDSGFEAALTYQQSNGNFTKHTPFFNWFQGVAKAANSGAIPQSKPKPTPAPAPKPTPKPAPAPAPAPSGGGGQTFTPVDDTYIRTYDSSPHGRERSILVKDANDSHYDRQGAIKFDISKLSGTVGTATVRVYGSLQKNAPSISLEAYAADTTSFSEGSADYNYQRPNATGTKLDTVTVSGTGDKWYDLDVTNLVRDAKNRGTRYVSVVLKAVQASSNDAYVELNSKESSSGAPQLSVSSSSSGGATSQSVGGKSFRPTNDTYVRNGEYAAHGSEKALLVKRVADSSFNREGLIKFDLGGLTKTASSATISLFGGLHQPDAPVKIDLYQTGTNWGEGSVNWGNQPSNTGGRVDSITVGSSSDQWYTLDVTDEVKAAQKAGRATIAFALEATKGKSRAAYVEFNSKEASSNQPKLTVA